VGSSGPFLVIQGYEGCLATVSGYASI
jgi:hypothetical protein